MRWCTGDGGTLGNQRDSEDHADARSEDERRSEFRSGNNARRSLANPDDRARRHPARVDIDEQAERRGRPGANPRETRKVPRRLQQNREVLGYNADRLLHILVLLTRHQSIEGKGEDFLCICSENSATDSRDRSPRHQLAILLFSPSRPSFLTSFLKQPPAKILNCRPRDGRACGDPGVTGLEVHRILLFWRVVVLKRYLERKTKYRNGSKERLYFFFSK